MSDVGDAVALLTTAYTTASGADIAGLPDLNALAFEYSSTPIESLDPAAMAALVRGLIYSGTHLMIQLGKSGEDPLAALQTLALDKG